MFIESVMPSNHFISVINSVDMNLSKLQEVEEDRGVCGAAALGGPKRVKHDLVTEQQRQQMGKKSKKEGIHIFVWPIHFAVPQKQTQHYKATML